MPASQRLCESETFPFLRQPARKGRLRSAFIYEAQSRAFQHGLRPLAPRGRPLLAHGLGPLSWFVFAPPVLFGLFIPSLAPKCEAEEGLSRS